MDLSLIFTVPGKPGLYKLISQGRTSAIVESLSDKKRTPIFNMDRVSSLAEIAIYTQDGETSLPDVFRSIHKKENAGPCPDHNGKAEELRAYFSEILPGYDQERVYDSNIRKVLQWYNILQANGLVDQELSEREKAQREGLKEHEAEHSAASGENAEEPSASGQGAENSSEAAASAKASASDETGEAVKEKKTAKTAKAAKPAAAKSSGKTGKKEAASKGEKPAKAGKAAQAEA